jgi:hypothetical protein
MYLESRALAANTINQQLAAVCRPAYEAADAGLLSPELAAGISRVKAAWLPLRELAQCGRVFVGPQARLRHQPAGEA